MKLKVLALIAVVVLAAGCISNGEPETDDNSQPDSEPPADSNADTSNTGDDADSSNTIYLTDDGFTPESLTIEQGETVTWVDNSSDSMWVGSDRHPTHTDYDGTSVQEHCSNGDEAFDQCETGDRFSFTFEKTGEWGYHNHEPYIEGGTITVQ